MYVCMYILRRNLSLRSRRLEVVGTSKNGRVRSRDTRVSPLRAPVLSFAHYSRLSLNGES